MIKTDTGNLCSSCKKFVKKFKPWDESKVPEVAIIDHAICRKCKMDYQIYKGMIWGVPSYAKKMKILLLDVIDMLEKKIGKPVPKEEVIAAAEEQGVKEEDVEELLIRLKIEGSIFEPKLNFIERIEKREIITKAVLAKVRKLSDEELLRIVETFDNCVWCWDRQPPQKCRHIRKKIGLSPCGM